MKCVKCFDTCLLDIGGKYIFYTLNCVVGVNKFTICALTKNTEYTDAGQVRDPCLR